MISKVSLQLCARYDDIRGEIKALVAGGICGNMDEAQSEVAGILKGNSSCSDFN